MRRDIFGRKGRKSFPALQGVGEERATSRPPPPSLVSEQGQRVSGCGCCACALFFIITCAGAHSCAVCSFSCLPLLSTLSLFLFYSPPRQPPSPHQNHWQHSTATTSDNEAPAGMCRQAGRPAVDPPPPKKKMRPRVTPIVFLLSASSAIYRVHTKDICTFEVIGVLRIVLSCVLKC